MMPPTEANSRTTVCEMSPRDGLQVVNHARRVSFDERVALLDDLRRAGFPYVEAGAFVSARRIPAMADTAQLLRACRRPGGAPTTRLGVLIPNLKYYRKFRDAGGLADDVAVFVSASDAYSMKNTRMSIDEALTAAAEVVGRAVADGHGVRAHVSGAFRDLTPQNSPTAVDDVAHVCSRLREAHAPMVIALADTDGLAGEDDVARVLHHLEGAVGLAGIGVHLHDRAGSALRNARVAWGCGVRVFDAAVGGVGGNPSALDDPVGNVDTRRLVGLLESLGAETGIDQAALDAAAARVARMVSLSRAGGDGPVTDS